MFPLPAILQTPGTKAGKEATGRLGMRATLPWKRRQMAPDESNDEEAPASTPTALPAWLLAGLMVLMILAAAALGAALYRIVLD